MRCPCTGQRDECRITARPAYDGQPDWQLIDVCPGNGDLGRSSKAADHCQAGDARAKRIEN